MHGCSILLSPHLYFAPPGYRTAQQFWWTRHTLACALPFTCKSSCKALAMMIPWACENALLIMYDHPRFLRSTQLQDACRRIPEPTLHGYLAKHFWQLHVAHTPGHGVQGFLKDLGYHWLHYSWSDEAAQSFWDNFDERGR